jgi:LAO/AO transport system kinase
MLEERQSVGSTPRGHDDTAGQSDDAAADGDARTEPPAAWSPPIVETVATEGEGVADLRATLLEHGEHLRRTGELDARRRSRRAAQLRRILREDAAALVEDAITANGGIEALVDRMESEGTDPYRIVADVMGAVLEESGGPPRTSREDAPQ